VKDLFSRWLEEYFPDRKERVLNKLRMMRHGEMNDNSFCHRNSGDGPYAEYIDNVFELAKKRYGLNQRLPSLSTENFRRDGGLQLKLF
jgi:DNA repair photolyase